MTTTHVVQFSGGIGSWAVAQLIAGQHGTDDLVLLFTDVLNEDPDTYRFLRDAGLQLGVPVTRICEGRTPFEVFADEHFLGNSRFAPCSRTLKIRPARKWVEEHFPDPSACVLYVGIDRSEQRRIPAIASGWAPYQVEFPLCWGPYPTWAKQDMLSWARGLGVEPPAMYGRGFDHNNCAGRCVRGGIKHWTRLLEQFPERYRESEELENRLRHQWGKDVSILRETRKGIVRNLTLTQLRERIQGTPDLFEGVAA